MPLHHRENTGSGPRSGARKDGGSDASHDEVSTGSNSRTQYIDESGEQVYPCRCGVTHSGPYAIYEYGHHNCFHNSPLSLVDEDVPGYLMCPDCGKTFWIEGTVP